MYNKLTESTTELAISIRENAIGKKHNIRKQRTVTARGGHLGIFWVGMCRPGLQIGTPF